MTVGTVVFLATAAAVLSYAGLRDLAIDAGLTPILASIFPLTIDGLGLVGSVSVIYAGMSGLRTWFPWLLTLIGVAASVAGNIASSPDDWWSRGVHAAPPLVLALALEALLRIFRHQIHAGVSAVATAGAVPGGQPVAPVAVPAVGYLPAPAADREVAEQHTRVEAPGAQPVAAEVQEPSDAEPSAVVNMVHEAPAVPDSPDMETFAAEPAGEVDQPSGTEPAAAAHSFADDANLPLRRRIEMLIAVEPTVTGGEAARRLGSDPSYTRKLLREIRGI